jgi:hypothetical protein
MAWVRNNHHYELGLEFALSNSGSAAVLKLISAYTQPLFSRQQKQAGKPQGDHKASSS